MNDWTTAATWAIFLATYAGLALGKIPGLRIDRAGIALVGATLALIAGLLTVEQAFGADSVDYRTLLLLLGMMIVVAGLRLAGFFERVAGLVLRGVSTPKGLLAATIALSGIASAFLINDVVCVALTPLVLHLARRLKFNPLPHLIALATAANIGSTGTITGNPQNIYIGAHSGISYGRFALRLLPVAAIGLVINYWVISLVYRKQLARAEAAEETRDAATVGVEKMAVVRDTNVFRSPRHQRLLVKCLAITIGAIVLFFVGLPLELVALGAASLVLLDRVALGKIWRLVDWPLLVMFTGLFIVVHAFQQHVVTHWGIDRWTWILLHPTGMLSLVSAALSNLVSNVPAVLLLEPLAQAATGAAKESAWLALAMSSTLAGNLTVLGSVANLIVVERAKREGVEISLWDYGKVGLPLTIVTLLVGVVWLAFVRY